MELIDILPQIVLVMINFMTMVHPKPVLLVIIHVKPVKMEIVVQHVMLGKKDQVESQLLSVPVNQDIMIQGLKHAHHVTIFA